MPNRRRARELAMQAIFAIELGRQDPATTIAELLAEPVDADTRLFVKELVFGTLEHAKSSDEIIAPLMHDWSIDRIPAVDRVILRMAVYELLHTPEMPKAVVLNEAVELAHRYSTESSGRFINGVLSNVQVNLH